MTGNTFGSPESPIAAITDHTVAAMPSWIIERYQQMNDTIAAENTAFGASTQRRHLMLSQRAISATARTALHRAPAGEERTAIILGPGGCFDIPLEEIVTEFDRTKLVDVDTQQTERALSELPAKILGKVSLLKSDITGNVAKLSSIIGRARSLDHKEFTRVATAAVKAETDKMSVLQLEGKYSFTCSQLLMTQLSCIPHMGFAQFVREQYRRPLAMCPGLSDGPLLQALNDHNIRTQRAHIAHLAQLAKPGGTVHFADTVAERKGSQILPMVTLDFIDEIDSRFDRLAEDQNWEWCPLPDRAFAVFGYSLTPKPN